MMGHPRYTDDQRQIFERPAPGARLALFLIDVAIVTAFALVFSVRW